jgi:hypothetical protein
MGIFESVLTSIIRMMTFPINIYGVPVTLWGAMIFTLAGGVLFGLIGRLLNGE